MNYPNLKTMAIIAEALLKAQNETQCGAINSALEKLHVLRVFPSNRPVTSSRLQSRRV